MEIVGLDFWTTCVSSRREKETGVRRRLTLNSVRVQRDMLASSVNPVLPVIAETLLVVARSTDVFHATATDILRRVNQQQVVVFANTTLQD